MLSWLASILSRPAGSICFLPDPFLELAFCTRYVGVVAVIFGDGLGGVTNPFDVSWSVLGPGACSDVPQRHFCFLGIAAVTAAQVQGRDAGCGHELSGRPGLRTGTMSPSAEGGRISNQLVRVSQCQVQQRRQPAVELKILDIRKPRALSAPQKPDQNAAGRVHSGIEKLAPLNW
ncbi:hypothetical protein Trco_004876 [Trichoderma cornu-damae]|uniref:Uncharacterized protein n=1 Tax=Trichoderma cornu-damae TaxID=654480 RepID=A0A9P8TUU9_9HYPO|nr:hypothetical protein Trco_004876 [Trichoderma cornu-damae]